MGKKYLKSNVQDRFFNVFYLFRTINEDEFYNSLETLHDLIKKEDLLVDKYYSKGRVKTLRKIKRLLRKEAYIIWKTCFSSFIKREHYILEKCFLFIKQQRKLVNLEIKYLKKRINQEKYLQAQKNIFDKYSSVKYKKDELGKDFLSELEIQQRIEELEMKKEFEVAVGKWDCLKRHLDDEIAKYEEQQKSDDELTSLKAQKWLIPLYEQRKTEEEFHWLLDNYQYLDAVKAITQHGKFEKKGIEWVVKLNQDKVFMQSEEYENKKALATAIKVVLLLIFVPVGFLIGAFLTGIGCFIPFLGAIMLPLGVFLPSTLIPIAVDYCVFGDKLPEETKDKHGEIVTAGVVGGITAATGIYNGTKNKKK